MQEEIYIKTIMKQTCLTREEIEKRVTKKKEELKDMVSEEGALFIIAKELNVEISGTVENITTKLNELAKNIEERTIRIVILSNALDDNPDVTAQILKTEENPDVIAQFNKAEELNKRIILLIKKGIDKSFLGIFNDCDILGLIEFDDQSNIEKIHAEVLEILNKKKK